MSEHEQKRRPQLEPLTDHEYTPTIGGSYTFDTYKPPESLADLYKCYLQQRRRAIITELRALDTLLGRTQSLPRKER